MMTACSAGDGDAPATRPAPAASQGTSQSASLTPMQRGERLWKRCRACHNVEAGARHKVGPNLHGIYGMTAGTQEAFNYSKAMAASGIVWDDETLDAYLADPRGYIPGNRMSFIGLKKEQDRADLLLWLRERSEG